MTPTDDLERRLRASEGSGGLPGMEKGVTTCWYRTPDGPEAADEIARLRAENEALREAAKIALTCTPSARNGEVIYDCGNPWEVLSTALQEGSRHE